MGKLVESPHEIRNRLKRELATNMVEAYELGGEDGYTDGYDTGCEDERRDIIDGGLVIRWSDGEVYSWQLVPGHWEHTPHRWAEVLNE